MSTWPTVARVRGLWNLGRPDYPPLPMWILMTDRVTGVVYVLRHTGDPGSLTLDLSATNLPTLNIALYGPLDGPWLNGVVRLFVSDGTLSSEIVYPRPGNWNPRVFARRGVQRLLLEIRAAADGTLSYHEVEVET